MNNEYVIKMPRRFDYASSADFNEAFARAANDGVSSGKKIILDCSNLEYIDSAGIGLLVMRHKKTQAEKSALVIANAKPSVKEILLLANLHKIIEII